MDDATIRSSTRAVSGGRELTSPLFAFQPILQPILGRALAGGRAVTTELLGKRAAARATHEPAFRDAPGVASLPPLPELPPESARGRLVEAVAATVLALARPASVLLVLPGHQLLILSTLRATEVPASTTEMLRAAHVRRSELDRLSEASVGRMVADMLAMDAAPPSTVSSLFRHSAGKPLPRGSLPPRGRRDRPHRS